MHTRPGATMRGQTTGVVEHWRRGGPSLWLGACLLACLLCARAWVAMNTRPEVNRLDFRFEPAHPAQLREWLQPAPLTGLSEVADDGTAVEGGVSLATTDSLCGAPVDLLATERCEPMQDGMLRDPMPPVARVGRPYRFAPRASRPVQQWRLVNAPDGVQIDANSGIISGTPTVARRYDDVVLVAQLDRVTVARQHLTMFVDDRYLILGADRVGDDIFENLVRSTEFIFLPALVTVLVGVVGAGVLGALAGYSGGRLRDGLLSVTAALQSIPGLLLLFVAAVATNSNRWLVMIAAGLVLAPETALGILERVEQFRRRDFVSAARELGLRDRQILWNEIIWHNTRDFVVNRIANGFLFAALMEITLSYAGLLDKNSASLGNMIRSGREALSGQTSNGEAAAAIVGLLTVVATFSLLERGIRQSWARRR